jgi:hypothetical protein
VNGPYLSERGWWLAGADHRAVCDASLPKIAALQFRGFFAVFFPAIRADSAHLCFPHERKKLLA